MAFSGIHIACGFVGGINGLGDRNTPLLRGVLWSETQAAAGITASAAYSGDPSQGTPCFEIAAAADSWVAIGPAPDPTNGARILVRAGTSRAIYAKTGDKVAWTPA